MTRYFRMMDDVHVPGRWYLADPIDGKGQMLEWVFSRGTPVRAEGPVRVPFSKHARRGVPVDYCELAADVVPVVHVRVALVLAELAPDDVEIVPVQIPGQPDQFCIVNVIKVVKCIDDQRSDEVRHVAAESGQEQAGQYESVIGMRIDPMQVGNTKVFRTWGWLGAIVVSEEIKEALQAIGTVGVTFVEV